MSTSEITPAPVKAVRSAEAGEANMKGPYAMTQVNESIQREQQGWGPFVGRKKKAAVVEPIVEAGEPQRHFKLLSLSKFTWDWSDEVVDKKVGLAYAILNSWVAMATSLSIALPSGGPTAILWGLIVSFLGNLAMSASLAEM